MKQVKQSIDTEQMPGDVAVRADGEELDQLQTILNDVQLTGGKYRVERKGPHDAKYQHVMTCPSTEPIDKDHIAKIYGGGDYLIRTFRPNGQMFKQATFSIDYRFKGSMDAIPAQVDGGAIADTVVSRVMKMSGNNPSAEVFSTMLEQSNKMFAILLAQMSQAQQAQMAMLVEAMKPRSPDPLMLELVRGSMVKTERTPLNELMEAVRTIRGLENGTEAPEDKPKDWMDRIGEIVTPIAEILAARSKLGNGHVNNVPHDVANGHLPSPQESTPVKNHMNATSAIPMLMSLHSSGKKPEDVPDIIAGYLDPDSFDGLRTALSADDWTETVFANDPRISGPFGEWLRSIRNAIVRPVTKEVGGRHFFT